MTIEQTLAERGSRYGDFSDHAKIAQAIQDDMRIGAGWKRLDGVKRQALTVIADKIARILSGDPSYADNWHDIQGYAKLVEDRLPAVVKQQFTTEQHPISESFVTHTHSPADPACKVVEPAADIDDESPRMQAIGQNGNTAHHYDELLELAEVAILNGGAPLKEPQQPRHRCLACAGGHATHQCQGGT